MIYMYFQNNRLLNVLILFQLREISAAANRESIHDKLQVIEILQLVINSMTWKLATFTHCPTFLIPNLFCIANHIGSNIY